MDILKGVLGILWSILIVVLIFRGLGSVLEGTRISRLIEAFICRISKRIRAAKHGKPMA